VDAEKSSPPATETKTILRPDAFTKLMFRKFGGKFFIHGNEVIDGLEQMTFQTGPEGKRQKLEAAEQGLVIVQRGIVTTVRDIYRKILVSERIGHEVTGGGSILVSGDGDGDPEQILRNKLIIDGDIDGSFDQLGLGFSNPENTGGINYLFIVGRLRLQKLLDISAPEGKDPVQFQTLSIARNRIEGKAMEEAILKELQRSTF
jgi:hypothetical protein